MIRNRRVRVTARSRRNAPGEGCQQSSMGRRQHPLPEVGHQNARSKRSSGSADGSRCVGGSDNEAKRKPDGELLAEMAGKQPAAARKFGPLSRSPAGGKPGRAGAPHAGSTPASQPTALSRRVPPAPPTRGLPPPCAIPRRRGGNFGNGPVARKEASRASRWSAVRSGKRSRRKKD